MNAAIPQNIAIVPAGVLGNYFHIQRITKAGSKEFGLCFDKGGQTGMWLKWVEDCRAASWFWGREAAVSNLNEFASKGALLS